MIIFLYVKYEDKNQIAKRQYMSYISYELITNNKYTYVD